MDEKAAKTVARRRAHGEGSIFKRTLKRKDGTAYQVWAAQVDLGRNGAGKRVRQTVYGQTQAEVRSRLDGLKADKRTGKKPADGKVTVGEYLTAWLTTIQNRQPKTVTHYTYAVNSHLAPNLGAIKLERLTAADVETMLADRSASGLSPRTVHHLLIILRSALTAAVNQDLLSRNVATKVKGPAQTGKADAIHFLEPEQARRLLAAAESDRLSALYVAALDLGARQGELLGLQWKDVDFARGTIQINRSLQRVAGKLSLKDPKTLRSRRMIHMSARVAGALTAHKERQEAERKAAAGHWQGEPDLVFRTALGRPLDGTVVTHRFQQVAKAAGLPRMPFHDLRHSCASLLLKAGVPAKVVADQLGHSSIIVTLNTYSHVMPAGRAEAAEAMDRAY
jgi:integrase